MGVEGQLWHDLTTVNERVISPFHKGLKLMDICKSFMIIKPLPPFPNLQ